MGCNASDFKGYIRYILQFKYKNKLIDSLLVNEVCNSNQGETSRKAELSVLARKKVSAKDIEEKYFATIPNGTQAFILGDPSRRKWDHGQAVIDTNPKAPE